VHFHKVLLVLLPQHQSSGGWLTSDMLGSAPHHNLVLGVPVRAHELVGVLSPRQVAHLHQHAIYESRLRFETSRGHGTQLKLTPYF